MIKKEEKQIPDNADDLREAYLELKASEERYHKMIDEVQDYAIILLDEKGTILNWNKGAEKIKRYTSSEIIGKNFSVFYLPEDQKTDLPGQLIKQAANSGKAIHEGWRVRKDRSRFWGSITITALHGENNQIIGFSKVTRDLTEKKLSDDKLLQYTAELEVKNKELEQFAYVASHDLQEPLRKIQTFAEIVRKNIKDENLVNKYFEKINTSAQRMAELIKSILSYSRLVKEAEEFTNVDLNAVVANVKVDFELLIEEKKAQVKSDLLPVVKGSLLQLTQLFANLISNALKFTDKNPTIFIKAKSVKKNEMINPAPFLAEGKYTEIIFTDNGIGFDQQYENKIFTIFQRLHGKQEYAGTGIGLALCKKIVENHHGYITAKSELGKGATFYVYLPL
ncbi:MAG TPA: ATP-binding protein [Cyclobacteriaceae bacterium]